MEVLKDVSLHVYQLEVVSDGTDNLNRGAAFFSRMLPSLGMGAYHTSLEIDGYRYTFAANVGIIKTKSEREGLPPSVTYKERIDLGACSCSGTGQINTVVQKLGQTFHKSAYHLVQRNCNHFTETFATALVLYDELVDKKQGRLKTYPEWINRLANTSKMLVGHDDEIVPCNVIDEARKAVGADERVGWNLSSKTLSKEEQRSPPAKGSKQGKKTLTEAQKKALAKIRGPK